MTQWTANQRAALNALKIPSLELKSTAQAPTADLVSAPEEPQEWLYQVGVWTLCFPNELPVPRYPWLEDLCRAYDTRPTHINGAKAGQTVVNCAFVAKPLLSQEEKRTLWAQLKPLLTQ
ncbi:MAG: hypothetical protein HLUCCO02_11910 [Idiomarinaceae bacterium HL-53]|nr:MAG: hypothetical protein HLUCCO02_11910 [Idiomarinaceae bacterium HL-53]CUS49429.1 hypothetical protein Ga0003345_2422 [Idiomarinaceae bacterium HL-53]